MSWLREALCEDYAEVDRQRGRLPNTKTIEWLADRDIENWQANEREKKHVWDRAPDRSDEDRHQAAKEIAKKGGAKLRVTDNIGDSPITKECPCGNVCKYCKMRARMLQLIEPLPPGERKKDREAHLNCKYPGFAKEILDLWNWSKFSRRGQSMDPKDRDKELLRKLENICDRSRSVIGLGDWH